MKDFPMFTTEYGVASLILKEVPYRQEAYIVIQSTEEPEALLKECVSFCRMVGAEKIYARGHEIAEQYPLHAVLFRMQAEITVDEAKVKNLWPVTAETVERWRSLFNQRMSGVDHASTLERRDEREILEQGSAYFVHNNGRLLGGGWITGDELRLIAAVEKGAGETVLHTLLSVAPQVVSVQVISTNRRAIGFYERMGFVKTEEIHRWYRVV